FMANATSDPGGSITAQAAIDSFVKALQSSKDNIKIIPGPAAATYNGITWNQKVLTARPKGSTTTLKIGILAVYHADKLFLVMEMATNASFAQENTNGFIPILQSFTFTH